MLSDYCIYTIKHSDDLHKTENTGRAGTYVERRRWASANRLLEKAQQEGRLLPIVFAPAEKTNPLFGWALLDKIIVEGGETRYSFSELRPFPEVRHKSSLKKRNGERLSQNFIRPYAICRTPAYLREV